MNEIIVRLSVLAIPIFILALIHSLIAPLFHKRAQNPNLSRISKKVWHLAGEVELVFGLWAIVFLFASALVLSVESTQHYFAALDFHEVYLIFAIMLVAGTEPILRLVRHLLVSFSHLFQSLSVQVIFFILLAIAPLLGSLITEPAAMTLIGLLMAELFFAKSHSLRFKYACLAVLFVNVSIGGVLTHFAAPPVLMVASRWNWDSLYMAKTFGMKAITACIFNGALMTYLFRNNLRHFSPPEKSRLGVPIWLCLTHLLVLMGIVYFAKVPFLFLGILAAFIGLMYLTKPFNKAPRYKESFLVSFFLAGLVVLGGPQKVWLEPLLKSLSKESLFIATSLLTAVTDNAAITFLGSQIEGLSNEFKYFLVAGAVTGGGLTVIANAPNPAGYSILNRYFPGGIKAHYLFLAALPPTLISGLCFYYLP